VPPFPLETDSHAKFPGGRCTRRSPAASRAHCFTSNAKEGPDYFEGRGVQTLHAYSSSGRRAWPPLFQRFGAIPRPEIEDWVGQIVLNCCRLSQVTVPYSGASTISTFRNLSEPEVKDFSVKV
jgi:hypothetical protein